MKIAKFVGKLFNGLEQIQQNKNNISPISWSNTYDSIIIKNNSQVEDTLIEFFDLKKLSSFIRQLNIYGFYKTDRTDCIEYKSKYFKKLCPENLFKIKRKKSKQQNSIIFGGKKSCSEIKNKRKEQLQMMEKLKEENKKRLRELEELKTKRMEELWEKLRQICKKVEKTNIEESYVQDHSIFDVFSSENKEAVNQDICCSDNRGNRSIIFPGRSGISHP